MTNSNYFWALKANEKKSRTTKWNKIGFERKTSAGLDGCKLLWKRMNDSDWKHIIQNHAHWCLITCTHSRKQTHDIIDKFPLGLSHNFFFFLFSLVNSSQALFFIRNFSRHYSFSAFPAAYLCLSVCIICTVRCLSSKEICLFCAAQENCA